MSRDLERQQAAVPTNPALTALLDQAAGYAAAAKSDRTKKEYSTDYALFTEWCASIGVQTLPAAPETIVAYITHLANEGRKASTISRKLSALSVAHKTSGYDSPTDSVLVETVWRGLRNTIGTKQDAKKALTVDQLRAMVAAAPDTTIGLRDRALLLVGFAGAFRREELAALDMEDVEFSSVGMAITVRGSKTDQEGAGETVGVPYGEDAATCPVRALQTWLAATGIATGAIFRSVTKGGNVNETRITGKDVARCVKKYVEAVGLDAKDYAGHSLRAGLATEAARAGKEERDIMRQTRHKSMTVARRYIREGSLFANNAASGIGL